MARCEVDPSRANARRQAAFGRLSAPVRILAPVLSGSLRVPDPPYA